MLSKNKSLSLSVKDKSILELKFMISKTEENLQKLKKVQLNLDKEILRYANEKKSVEARIDLLRNDERKLLREVGFMILTMKFYQIKMR